MIDPGLSWPEQISAEREQIAVALYRNVPTRSRSVIVKLLTESFVDEYVDAILDDRPPALREWIERMSARPGRAQ
ncbi:MAG: hypothetical protein JO101_03580, partial [Candidatus Eremiobacteraeota bacterium]|nr:hypothetical protein [Candidatus Eremiobacteraeota bacterium]